MKGLLLFAAGTSFFMTGVAQEITSPIYLEGASIQNISPNGRYVVATDYGAMHIYDLVKDQKYTYMPEEITSTMYFTGLGNNISATGIVLGATSGYTNAMYWKDGEWNALNVDGNNGNIAISHGITPDGKRICGGIGFHPWMPDNATMLEPAYWEADEDGFGKYHLLPYPDRDLTGRTPQYVVGLSISDDGKTIAGLMTDFSGFLQFPIIFKEGEDGEWSYTMPINELFNPDNVDIPEWPGAEPVYPDAIDYMSEKMRVEYEEDYAAYLESNYTLPWPDPRDYLNEEETSAYDKALEEYNVLMEEWNVKFMAFNEVFFPLQEAAPRIAYNNALISGDGQYAIYNSEGTYQDPTYEPWRIDTSTWELEKVNNAHGLYAYSVTTNGYIVAGTPVMSNQEAFIEIEDGSFQPLYDWMLTKNQGYAEWMKQSEKPSGTPHATPDLNVISCWTNNPMGASTMFDGWVFDLNKSSGINSIELPSAACTVAYVQLYDITGKLVDKALNVEEIDLNKCGEGIYILVSTMSDGTVKSEKIAI
ncbi:MAG: T9SS type A sorting domain-containing protein [Bacteroides sp.]|nr:T9SS type A sorting domain-containing protein [Bacteroides sp.]